MLGLRFLSVLLSHGIPHCVHALLSCSSCDSAALYFKLGCLLIPSKLYTTYPQATPNFHSSVIVAEVPFLGNWFARIE
jgi:hypothetical protein